MYVDGFGCGFALRFLSDASVFLSLAIMYDARLGGLTSSHGNAANPIYGKRVTLSCSRILHGFRWLALGRLGFGDASAKTADALHCDRNYQYAPITDCGFWIRIFNANGIVDIVISICFNVKEKKSIIQIDILNCQ